MKKIKHIGCYGIIVKNNKILLINKSGGPYDGMLDLPGGTIEFNETLDQTLKREIKEETNLNVIKYNLFNVGSSNIKFLNKGEVEEIKHIFILYKILEYDGVLKTSIDIDKNNDDSKGARFYLIDELDKTKLSKVAYFALERIKNEL